MCAWGRVVAVVTGPDLGEEEVQSRRVPLDEEGYMDGGREWDTEVWAATI